MIARRRRNWLVVLGSLFVALAICELIARLLLNGADSARERANFMAAYLQGSSASARVPIVEYQLHPYWAFSFLPEKGRINNQGLRVANIDYPYLKQPKEFVVGLFGGSVAAQLADEPTVLLRRLEPALRRRGFERVTLLPFAVGGWRQPQQFYAMLSALSTLDMVIDLDGINEVGLGNQEQIKVQPADFPWSQVYQPLAHPVTQTDTLRRAELIRAKMKATRFTSWLNASALRHLRVVHMIWRAWASRLIKETIPLRQAEERAALQDWVGYDPAFFKDALLAKRGAYLDHWIDLIRFSQLICARKQKLFFHFIQPNQHLEGSKPLSKDELAVMAAEKFSFPDLAFVYGRWETASKELHAAGVESYFLGRIFEREARTLYRDGCCHLNNDGLDLLAQAMADRILASGLLAHAQLSAAAAGSPTSPIR